MYNNIFYRKRIKINTATRTAANTSRYVTTQHNTICKLVTGPHGSTFLLCQSIGYFGPWVDRWSKLLAHSTRWYGWISVFWATCFKYTAPYALLGRRCCRLCSIVYLCHCRWRAPSCSASSMQVIWLRPNTYKSSERLYWHFNNTNNMYNQQIARWRLLPSHVKSALSALLLREPTLNIIYSINTCWPLCNLSFLLKVLEKVVNQLHSHIDSSNTSNHCHSV